MLTGDIELCDAATLWREGMDPKRPGQAGERSSNAKGKVMHPSQGNAKHNYRLDGKGIESSPEENDLAGLVVWKFNVT